MKDIYSELMPVDTVIYNANLGVWTLQKNETLESFHINIQEQDVVVGITRGSLAIKKYLQKLQVKNIYEVNTTAQGIQMLLANRLHYFAEFDGQMIFYADKLDTNNKLHLLGNIQSNQYYPLINKKHQHLAIPFMQNIKAILAQRGGPLVVSDIYGNRNNEAIKAKASTKIK